MTATPSSRDIIQQILQRLPEARKAWEHDLWASCYVADVQFLLGRLQTLEAHLSLPRACPECNRMLPLLLPPDA